MPPKKHPNPSSNKTISITGDVKDSVVIVGDNNTVNQTIIQKFFNIFKSDAETLEQRNRRILLNHVENAWIKGVLDVSLYGAAMLDLGIKETPEAITNKYPWAIKKEATDEILPDGTSMLKIFDFIGMGRSLLILGAPGSGKTTMLLELARGLIARAREDVTQPIPMVCNLASWTEKFTLADWLAQELNNLYSVPRKTAPDWVKGNKLLLLLDGLDEVRQESRAKCVEAINEFRKQNGLTSLAVCSRSQDYADLNAKLSFEGAIEVQPLTQRQIAEFFNRFGGEMAGIKQALEKDSELREIAETPLFLSIMLIAYRDKQDVEILVSGDGKARRKHLFKTYIERMFEHRGGARKFHSGKTNILRYLSWLACKMIKHNQAPLFIEQLQPSWLDQKRQALSYRWLFRLIEGSSIGLIFGVITGLGFMLIGELISGLLYGLIIIPFGGLMTGLVSGLIGELRSMFFHRPSENIQTVDNVVWHSARMKYGLSLGAIGGTIVGLFLGLLLLTYGLLGGLIGMVIGVLGGLYMGFVSGLVSGLEVKQIDQISLPGERLSLSAKNSFLVLLVSGIVFMLINGLIGGMVVGWTSEPVTKLLAGLIFGLIGLGVGVLVGLTLALKFGGKAIIQHYILRYILARNNLLPWRLVPFLDHCVDLIFLRRVGGGYIFIHRLLMEHFAEMYVESPTSKGNQKS